MADRCVFYCFHFWKSTFSSTRALATVGACGHDIYNRTYADTLNTGATTGGLPLQMVFIFHNLRKSCITSLHFLLRSLSSIFRRDLISSSISITTAIGFG